ncbi:MAG TPA: AfsR/SARP family transcriptional regulator, partial [Acidimicrobiia bacterium]|nr:AfsR/SARP family transcriptional regulator [Acidimicrobiia bacterium]
MDFRILGPLEVIDGQGASIRLPGGHGRSLLGILLLNAGRVISTDRLIDELWGEEPPPTATTALQGLVSRLRKALQPSDDGMPSVIQTHPPGYLLAIEPHQLDSKRFRRALKEAADRPALQRSEILRQALDTWRGPALIDFNYQPFAQAEITALEERRLAALEDMIDADLELGRHGEVVAELETLVAEHPLRERSWNQLMLALYRSGRQADALDAYRRLRRTLVEDLGIEPGRTTQDLEGAILRQDPQLDFSPLSPVDAASPDTGTWLPPGRK